MSRSLSGRELSNRIFYLLLDIIPDLMALGTADGVATQCTDLSVDILLHSPDKVIIAISGHSGQLSSHDFPDQSIEIVVFPRLESAEALKYRNVREITCLSYRCRHEINCRLLQWLTDLIGLGCHVASEAIPPP